MEFIAAGTETSTGVTQAKSRCCFASKAVFDEVHPRWQKSAVGFAQPHVTAIKDRRPMPACHALKRDNVLYHTLYPMANPLHDLGELS